MKSKNSKPFPRAERNGIFYCWIDGHLKSLRTRKPKIAKARHAQLFLDWENQQKAKRDAVEKAAIWTVDACFKHYLVYAASLEPNSLRNRTQTLEAFCDETEVKELPCTELTVDHLEAWIEGKGWSSSTRRTKISYVMAAFNYCVKRKKIKENPIFGMQLPRWERRKAVIGTDDEQTVYDSSKGPFRDILAVLRETGARPSELCSATVEHYQDGIITLTEHKEDESGEDRIIYLGDSADAVVRRLIGERTNGFIFRNTRGDQWTADTLYCRFKRIRKKLGLGDGVFPYALRHRFTSDKINNKNANPALIAKALGHADLNMLMKNYLRANPEAVRRALEELEDQ